MDSYAFQKIFKLFQELLNRKTTLNVGFQILIRLEMPFRGSSILGFDLKIAINSRKYRKQLDGILALKDDGKQCISTYFDVIQ